MGIYDSVMAQKQGTGTPGADASTDPVDAPSSLETGGSPFDASSFLPDLSQFVPQPTSQDRGPAMAQEDITAIGGTRGKIVRLARSFVGTPYVWGGTSPNGFDCSGFVQYVYGKLGINLPRISYQQANAGTTVALNKLQAGDLVAWDNSTRNNGADHIAIYLGGGLIAEAPRPGVNLRVRQLGSNEGAFGVRILGGKQGG